MNGMRRAILAGVAVIAAACSLPEDRGSSAMSAAEGRALVARHLPSYVKDRDGWAADIYAAMESLRVRPDAENICAVIAITEQESTFDVDPPVANLGPIARKEIERRAEAVGVPKLVVDAALLVKSRDGRSYAERIDAARTERELSDVYEDLVDSVPLGRRLLGDRNPVRTGGPMQVSVAFAQSQVDAGRYPYRLHGSVRDEIFTRRGGMYFGIAHLFDYPAPYTSNLYRFADFNAGRYASRNAAFQKAVADLTGIRLALDGDLVPPRTGKHVEGATESAARTLASRLQLSEDAISRDLELEGSPRFESSPTYVRVFDLAERASGRPVARAILPVIELKSPKITRKLTTEWFARRVEQRSRACLARG